MKTPRFVTCLAVTIVFLTAPVAAVTTQTIGAGSAVTSVDRYAAFDFLNYAHNDTHLDAFTDGLLKITTSGNSWVGYAPTDPLYSYDFDPFHGANGSDRTFHCVKDGNNDWVTIENSDAAKIYGVEFMYGNGWTTGQTTGPYPWGNHEATVDWQTWSGGSLVSSGTIGVSPLLEMGTILGFSDDAGFDQLLVRSTIASSGDPTLQVIALDNLAVQITPIPEPASMLLLGGALAALGLARRTRLLR